MTEDNLLALDKQLCFRIYSLNKTMTKLYAPLLKSIGLTYPQYLVMLVLWEANNSGVPVKHLSERLDLDTGTLSPLLKRMDHAELVSRVRSQSDERSVTITLTQKGKALREEAACIPEKLFHQTGMSVEELSDIQGKLDMLLATARSKL